MTVDRHQAARPEHFSEFTHFGHGRRRRDRHIKILKTFLAFLNQIFHADEFRAGFFGRLCRFTFCENEHSHLFSAAVWKRASTAHHLIGLLGIHPKAK